MVVVSLNAGLPKSESFFGKGIFTGICKQPIQGPLQLGILGFENDGVGDLKHHGGKDKAVCVYSRDHYPYWEDALGMNRSGPGCLDRQKQFISDKLLVHVATSC